MNHLQPDIRKEGWTTEEEELLVHAHSTFGNRWSAIAKVCLLALLASAWCCSKSLNCMDVLFYSSPSCYLRFHGKVDTDGYEFGDTTIGVL